MDEKGNKVKKWSLSTLLPFPTECRCSLNWLRYSYRLFSILDIFFYNTKALLFFMMSKILTIYQNQEMEWKKKRKRGKRNCKVERRSLERVKVAFFIITFHVCSQFILYFYIVCVVCCFSTIYMVDNERQYEHERK